MKIGILEILRYQELLPKVIMDMEAGLNALKQNVAKAADEIEKLREENRRLRKRLKDVGIKPLC